jgi:hypothetical protein
MEGHGPLTPFVHLTLRTYLSARVSFLARLTGKAAVSLYSPRDGPQITAGAAALSSCKLHVVHTTQATYDLLRFWEFTVHRWCRRGYLAWHFASRVGVFFSLISPGPYSYLWISKQPPNIMW